MNIYQKLALAIAGSGLISGAIGFLPATAATLTYNFKLQEMSGVDGYGSFSFNNSDVQGKPFEIANLLSFTFNFKGNTFTKSKFSGGGVYFREGNFRGLTGSVSGYEPTCMNNATNPYMQAYCEFGGSFGSYDNYAEPNNPYYVFEGFEGRWFFSYTPSYELVSTSESEGDSEGVPEPSTIGALLGLGIFKWNQSRRKQVNKASH